MADEIPQDVMEAAIACFDKEAALAAVDEFAPWPSPFTIVAVARAILAERERCVEIVEDYAHMLPSYPEFDGHYHAAADIAAAISDNGLTNHSKSPSRAEGKTA